ncbi:hypothetical protein MKX03_020573 [Papaver bracteatum]|nr:hypothetical protein MKX03_020573 [Papaver bracteatum]
MICRKIPGSVTQSSKKRDLFLNLISKSTTTEHLNQTHTQIIRNGFSNDLVTITKLTQKLSDFGLLNQAYNLFSSFSKPDIFLFNVIIRSFSHNNHHSSSFSLYYQLRKKTSLKPDNFTYALLVSSSSYLESPEIGYWIHCHSIIDGFQSDPFVGSSVADFYFKFNQVQNARKAFDKITNPDTVSWNTLISGLVRNCFFSESIKVFEGMLLSGTRFESTTLAAVLPAAAELQDMRTGKYVHCLAIKTGFFAHVYVLTGLVSLYSRCGDILTSKFVFEQINEPDLVSWNAIISGYSCNGEAGFSVKLFKDFIRSGFKADSSTIVGVLPVFSPFGHLCLCKSVHGLSIKFGVNLNSSVSTALITVYSRLNEIGSARKLFDEAPNKSLATWNSMISGYTQNGFTDSAINLFKHMQILEIRPNPVTLTSILSACAQHGAITLGKWIHELVIKEEFQSNAYVSTALIDMYAKCGSIDEAKSLFENMKEKNVVSWNAMISGYGLHGKGDKALNLFTEMLNTGISPTGVTFLSLLYSCCHSGLVSEGDRIFRIMKTDHSIEPGQELYACMVDLHGRAGKLEQALEFIKQMPVEPGPGVWGALLGACMTHNNKNLAKVASDKLFELDPGNIGHLVLLSNIYSTDQSYQEAAKVREIARIKNLKKIPGCTLIEVGGTVHVFTSGDRSHTHLLEIYAKLEELTSKMRELGFQTETDMALHDVEEEEKGNIVKVHSEKLAIAFGLISSEPGTEIRIIKNLRVCLDCHSATKFISKITNRMIVVRDANRFHHFVDGVCSCRDYW